MIKPNDRLTRLDDISKDENALEIISKYIGPKPDGTSHFFCCDVAMFEDIRLHLGIKSPYYSKLSELVSSRYSLDDISSRI